MAQTRRPADGSPGARQHDVVTVTGADARSYLHGQLTQDVASLTPGEERWTLALAPNGKIEALARLRCVDDETFELETDAGFGAALEARLNRFKIRVAAEIAAQAREVDGDAAEAEAARVAAGWPAMGREIVPGETIPAETGITEAAVDFRKGCYPGQELVERMASRGAAPPRSLRRVRVDSGAGAGDPIVDPASGDEVGTLTSVAGGWGLGYVRRGSTVGEPPSVPSSA